MSEIEALVFDVFGTVVDWRTSLIDNFTAWANKRGIKGDWTAGCIAVTNAEIEEIWAVTPIGTKVEVLP